MSSVVDIYGNVHALPGPFANITEVKAANKARGHFWFSPATLRSFDSRVEPTVYGGRLFITSELPPHAPRGWAIRCAGDDGSISTISEVCAYPTLTAAKAALLDLL